MSAARIIVLAIALIAGLGAAMLAGGSRQAAPPPMAAAPAMKTGEVLVATSDIKMGGTVSASNMRWQIWPADSISSQLISRESQPDAIQEYTKAIARSGFVQGEPLRAGKLIKSDGSGFMSAILDPGMRAVSVEISEETAGGGFILPNDRVDVILGRKIGGADGGRDQYASETILTNIRVLAIDQTIEDEKGEKVVVPKKTATLELTPKQAETMALAKQLGALSLTLRPLADANVASGPDANLGAKASTGNSITIVRFGVPTQTQATTR
jgi:pilus assembly protein CpaB